MVDTDMEDMVIITEAMEVTDMEGMETIAMDMSTAMDMIRGTSMVMTTLTISTKGAQIPTCM